VETQRITIPWPFVKTVKTLPGPLPCLYACASSWWAKSHGSCASPQAWIVLPCNLPRPRKSLELLEESLQTHFQNSCMVNRRFHLVRMGDICSHVHDLTQNEIRSLLDQSAISETLTS
jgi:hypothetical protein